MILHVTICVSDRRQLLAYESSHNAMVQAWYEALHWKVGRYLVMPDHVHFFCTPGLHDATPVRRWAGYWKRLVGNIAPRLKYVFQEDCWDTQMRTREHYEEKLSYVLMNPVRKGLVEDASQWPYQGIVHDVYWI